MGCGATAKVRTAVQAGKQTRVPYLVKPVHGCEASVTSQCFVTARMQGANDVDARLRSASSNRVASTRRRTSFRHASSRCTTIGVRQATHKGN